MNHWSDALPQSACSEAREWSATQPDYETAWAVCERADWMLWLIGRMDASEPMSDERRPLVRCALEIVRTVRQLMPASGVSCVDLVARWCDGEDVSRDKIRDATYAAAAYAANAAANAAADAAHAAADAAAHAAAYAAYAAYAAAYAANASLRSSADVVRRHYPTPPVLR